MAEYLDVVGDDIYFGSYKVATFDSSMWSTLRDHVEGLICGADQAEEVKGLEKTIEDMEADLKTADEDHATEVRRLEEAVEEADQRTEEADQRTEDAEAILREIGEDANCFATGRVLLAMQDKLRVAEQEIELLRAQLAAKPKKRK